MGLVEDDGMWIRDSYILETAYRPLRQKTMSLFRPLRAQWRLGHEDVLIQRQ